MNNTYTTKKGSVLPLMKLKGKDYMLIAHRMVWLADEAESYSTHVELIVNNAEETLAKATVIIYDAQGKPVRRAEDYKRETKKDFPDYTEKAVSGSLGRALAQLGFGTAYALSDLDEGTRLADAPVEVSSNTNSFGMGTVTVTTLNTPNPETIINVTPTAITETTAPAKSEFRRKNTVKNGSAASQPEAKGDADKSSLDRWS